MNGLRSGNQDYAWVGAYGQMECSREVSEVELRSLVNLEPTKVDPVWFDVLMGDVRSWDVSGDRPLSLEGGSVVDDLIEGLEPILSALRVLGSLELRSPAGGLAE